MSNVSRGGAMQRVRATGGAVAWSRVADFRKLRVWRMAHAVMINTHHAAQGVRGGEYLSLRSQMIRAAMSIPANIAEGRACQTDREFCRYLRHAQASGRELEYHLIAARDVQAIDEPTYGSLSAQLDEVLKMLHGLILRLEGRKPAPAP